MKNSVTLHASLTGFRILVMANRIGCDTDFARAVHDKLIAELADAAQMVLNPDSYYFTERYCEGDPVPLVDYLWVDHATKEWCSPEGNWHFLDGSEPEQIDVPDQRLCGLRSILVRIRHETGVSFSAYELRD